MTGDFYHIDGIDLPNVVGAENYRLASFDGTSTTAKKESPQVIGAI
jgi:hypothetical protein